MATEPRKGEQQDAVELEDALTELAWADPSICDDPAEALARLGVSVPEGLRVDVRIQRRDTLYFVIPPAAADGGEVDDVVNQMDLWRSGDQFVWIMAQDAKVALLERREQCRHHHDKEAR
jgi:hypothetical protein